MSRTKSQHSEFAKALDAETPELAELRATAQKLSVELSKEKQRNAQIVAAVYAAARDASLIRGSAKIPPRPARDRRKGSPEVALLHTTDWQVGKVTQTYSSEIAESRLASEMVGKVELLTDMQRQNRPVREAHYLLGGDMVEGITIFPGQAWAVDSTLFDQIFHGANILESIILHALTIFDVVHVWEEKGNHGRIGRKGENPDGDNMDLVMYRVVRERFRHERRVEWHPLKSNHAIWNLVEIGNYRALLVHGDEIKSFGGNTPAFGILRKCTKWRAGVAPSHSDVYMGHFHTPMTLVLPDGGFIYMTGSPESDNGYAMEFMAETGDPTQRLHFVKPETGRVTGQYILHFD